MRKQLRLFFYLFSIVTVSLLSTINFNLYSQSAELWGNTYQGGPQGGRKRL